MNLPNALSLARIFLVPLLVVVLLTEFEGRRIFGVPKELVGAAIFGVGQAVVDVAVIRGDVAPICIGERSNVQDGAVLHVDTGTPCIVGNEVTINLQLEAVKPGPKPAGE